MNWKQPDLHGDDRASDPASNGPEFEEAMEALRARHALRDPRLVAAAKDLKSGRAKNAERAASKLLARRPNDPDALGLMAEIAARGGRHEESERLLARCIRSAPERCDHRFDYVLVLERLGRLDAALSELDILLLASPRNLVFLDRKALLLGKTGHYGDAVTLYRALANDHPRSVYLWNALGGALRELGGCRDECRAAFLNAVRLAPWQGKVWQNLANLRSFRFDREQIAQMTRALSGPAVSAENRAALHFALARAFEDAQDYEKAFENYATGNAIRRVGIAYDPDSAGAMAAQVEAVFTPELFASRRNAGCPSAEPIFVVGLQRAGSTLIEQILASHSRIEGLGELDVAVRLVAEEIRPRFCPDYPAGIDRLDPTRLRELGEKYLAGAKARRRTGRPLFVDKYPYNFWHVGLIRLMLPNARIVDARRDPLACCFANLATNFSAGPPVSFKQSEIGRLYADYAKVMAHFDRVQPGAIHRVMYERVVADLESEVRALLGYLELPFEESCLAFYRNGRAFDSLSSDQVRSPIFTESVDRWRNFEPWLGQLKAALGPVLGACPPAP